MSETKLFHSKVLDHITGYTYVHKILSYVVSFSIVNYIYTSYVVPLVTLVNSKVLSVAPVTPYLTKFDAFADDLLTKYFDGVIIGYPLKTIQYLEVTFVAPVNNYLIAAHNKYFPETAYTASSDNSAVYTFFLILNEVLKSSRATVSNKSTEISNSLITTYNEELNSTKGSNLIAKNIEASYSTATKTFKSLNDDYLQPLKVQTQDYVSEVASSTKSRADHLFAEAKQTIDPALESLNAKGASLVNGSAAVVSASA
ncbi:uncharacterized protein RJT20DRAFT_1991 [Scheffersomyces xylosifermentans]|uniref:uncharacterized protein n=1 Tax=Scheffersomyces xylosifermentans TaxID=1304137 RepID=UPI00315D55CA